MREAGPSPVSFAGNNFQHSHTHTAGYSARNAPNAAQPRIGNPTDGINSNQ